MATSKKVTDLVAASTVAATDLMYIVRDPSGTPTSNSVTVNTFITANLNASYANVTAANILCGNGVVHANTVKINYQYTPTSNTDVPAGASNGSIFFDSNYLYIVANTASVTQKIKKVSLSSIS